jgi:hypothetical protein
MIDARLVTSALELMKVGRQSTADRDVWFKQVLDAFDKKKVQEKRGQLKNKLIGMSDPAAQIELLKQLKNETVGSER